MQPLRDRMELNLKVQTLKKEKKVKDRQMDGWMIVQDVGDENEGRERRAKGEDRRGQEGQTDRWNDEG